MAASGVPATLPAELPTELGMDAATLALQQRREAVRRRVRASVPPIPELRYEQAYLRSIMPALKPCKPDTSAAQGIEEGHEVSVDWRAVWWITLKDQVISPMFQGMFWGLLSIAGGGLMTSMRAGLGMPRSKPQAVPGDVRSNRPGEQNWRQFAKSTAGAVETATVL